MEYSLMYDITAKKFGLDDLRCYTTGVCAMLRMLPEIHRFGRDVFSFSMAKIYGFVKTNIFPIGPTMKNNEEENNITKPEHHIQQKLCTTRPLYRRGKKLTAVKVYTINNESQHLLFYGVPSLNVSEELKSLCLKYGELHKFVPIKQYVLEEFTELYHAHFKRIQSARIAKRFLDNKSFYGGVLHVCYAPEYETLSEVKKKLKQRLKDVHSRLQPGPTLLEYANIEQSSSVTNQNRKRKHPALPITEKRLKNDSSENIWDGIPKEIDPRISDPFLNYSSVGTKKHFQIPNNKPVGPVYGPEKQSTSFTSVQLENEVKTNLTSNKIEDNKRKYNKKIVFRHKIKK